MISRALESARAVALSQRRRRSRCRVTQATNWTARFVAGAGRAVAAMVLGFALAVPASARAAADDPILRIFLRDGTTLTSYGEYARINGRIVFSLPLGKAQGQPRLQLVTLDAALVDWTRTDQYRESVRAAQYAASRGESDFTILTGEVAGVLNDIALTADPQKRLALAEDARRRLNEWPAAHYGYRANDIREITALLDEAVSELRAAAGQQSFDLSLVANVEGPAGESLLAPPTPGEVIAQALSIADITDVPAERVALLRSTLQYLDASAGQIPEASRLAARDFARRRLSDELRADRAYAALTRSVAVEAERRAARADVRGLERLIRTVAERDARLGGRRPAELRSLVVSLQQRLDAARRLRLARDRWRLRASAYRSYTRLIHVPLDQLEQMRQGLDEIRRLAGPAAPELARIGELAANASRLLHAVVPPSELARVHSLLQSACAMGGNAARIRLEAVTSGNMTTAWNASAAAAGALMLLGHARDEMASYLNPPALR